MIRFVFAVPLLVHGLAHISGFLAAWTSADVGYREQSWLFSADITMSSPVGKAFGLLWLVAAIGLIGSGLGMVFRQDWWPALAMAASAISLVVILPWLRTVPPGAWVGAAFDVLVIVVLLTPLRDRIVELIQ